MVALVNEVSGDGSGHEGQALHVVKAGEVPAWMRLVEGNAAGAVRAVGARRQDVFMVVPHELTVIDGFNVRIRNEAYQQHVRGLADSMLSEGFYQDKPLAGFVSLEGGLHRINVYDGHCRLEAVKLAISEGAPIEHVPVVIASAGMTAVDMTVALVRSNAGRALEPLEKAMVCKRLLEMGHTPAEISRRLGFTQQYYRDLMVLLGADSEVLGMVERGEVSAKTAIALVRQEGDDATEVLRDGVEQARAAGKTKLTGKVLADPGKKVVTRNAPVLLDTLLNVRKDAAFGKLSQDTRNVVLQLLHRIEQERFKAETKASGVDLSELQAQEPAKAKASAKPTTPQP